MASHARCAGTWGDSVMPLPTIRVLLVDDHAVIRSGLSFFLSTTDDIGGVGEAADGEQALRLCAQLHPDIVLMDMLMPQMDGLTAMQQIRLHQPAIRVLALTSFLEGELVQRALQAGASGYLLKDVQARDLVVPPTAQALIARPRLIALLDDSLRRKLPLVSAPAGFGKPTLVAEWLRR
jgi:DNA-binding NarL/FixJ family response regulator